MARLPRKQDLKAIDAYLGDISTKLDKITSMENVFKIDPAPWEQIDVAIDRVSRFSEKFAKHLGAAARMGKQVKESLEKETKELEKQRRLADELEEKSKERAAHILRLKDMEEKMAKGKGKDSRRHQDIQRALQNQLRLQRQSVLQAWNLSDAVDAQQSKVDTLQARIGEMPDVWLMVAKAIGNNVLTAVDKLGKSLIALGVNSFFLMIDKGAESVKRVYELFERWTAAMGKLNLQVGALSPNMQGFTKMAKQWEGQVRGLTDRFGEGLAMASEFVQGFGRILSPSEIGKWGKLGLEVARGLGIGAQASGQLLNSMRQMGESPEQARKAFGEIVAGATAAGVPVNQFAREISDSRDFLVQFGVTGQKVFVQAAARARQLGVSLKALKAFTDMTDTFDSTATSMAKLNTVFGTSVNSLEMMMEQDPSRRLEMVRKALMDQGKTYENLSRSERKFLAQTMNLSEEEIAGVLKQGKTLNEFQKSQEKAKAKQLKDDQLLRRAQLATAETMFAFGAAFDKVTTAIAHLIKPLLDAIGLTGLFDDQGKRLNETFGGKMTRIFDAITGFIHQLAENPKWKTFLQKVASDLSSAFEAVMKWVGGSGSDGLQGGITGVVGLVEKFYDVTKTAVKFLWDNKDNIIGVFRFLTDNAGTILKIWAGAKVFSGIVGTIQGIKGTIDLVKWATGSRGVMTILSNFGSAMASATRNLVDFGGKAISVAGGAISRFAGFLTGPLSSAFSSVAGKLGAAGLVVAAGAAGYALGRFIGSLEVGGKKIDDWVVLGYEKIGELFNNLWRAFKESRLGGLLGMNDSASDVQKKLGMNDRSTETLAQAFGRLERGQASTKDVGYLKDMSKTLGADMITLLAKRGGVSEDRVKATLDGLPSMVASPVAATVAQTPMKTSVPVQRTTQLAVQGAQGSQTVQVVAGDVYLDSDKVGRSLARNLMSKQRGG